MSINQLIFSYFMWYNLYVMGILSLAQHQINFIFILIKFVD
jgi:hypothetical protein